MVHAAADEVQLGEPAVRGRRWSQPRGRYAAAAVAIAVLLGFGWFLGDRYGAGGLASVLAPPEEPLPRPDSAMATTSMPMESAPATVTRTQDGAPDRGRLERDLDRAWLESQDLRAWQELGAVWGRGADAALIEASCRGREGLGFACLKDHGSLLRIRQLGLPVVLSLVPVDGSAGQPQHLVLRGMADDRLLVGSRDDPRVVHRGRIEERWYGDFYVAWPQAANWPREVGRGDSGAAVDRILELAGRAEPPYAGRVEFGPDFEAWLREFQARHGLESDGIVGPKTLLYLMRATLEEPRLLGRDELEAAEL
jgi:hypothetical protein